MGNFVQVEEVGPVLYRSWANFPLHRFSYSLAHDIDRCGVMTKYKRFQGLVQKEQSAAMGFGICVEDAVKAYYLDEWDPVQHFVEHWQEYKDRDLKYSKNDGNWPTMESTGRYLMREFLRVKDDLPIYKPEFQVVLPRDPKATWYNGTRLEYLADLVNHESDEEEILDIKTSGRAYPDKDEFTGYPAMDPQLRTGSLTSGIRKVGFLVFVKTKTPRIQFARGTVTDIQLEHTDIWLKEQYHKLIERRLTMRSGVRFPDDHCLSCEYLCKCLGRDDVAQRTLIQKQSHDSVDLSIFDEV